MILLVLFVLTCALCAFLLAGLVDLAAVSFRRRALAVALDSGDSTTLVSRPDQWDRYFRRTPPGRWVERQLVLAGEEERRPLAVASVAVAGGLAVGWVLAIGLAPLFGLLGIAVVVGGIRWWLGRARQRRREQFVAQMPELARVLSNATSAGLSIAGAIGVAASELQAPAGPELARVASRMRFGADLDSAVGNLEERVPSREVAVLVSTLLVSARSGGSLVTALRDIAETLEERKETRREILTTLAQSTATGYTVIALGFGLMFLLNAIQPGTVDAMLGSWPGRIALIVSGSLFVGGFLLIRRMTRFDG